MKDKIKIQSVVFAKCKFGCCHEISLVEFDQAKVVFHWCWLPLTMIYHSTRGIYFVAGVAVRRRMCCVGGYKFVALTVGTHAQIQWQQLGNLTRTKMFLTAWNICVSLWQFVSASLILTS